MNVNKVSAPKLSSARYTNQKRKEDKMENHNELVNNLSETNHHAECLFNTIEFMLREAHMHIGCKVYTKRMVTNALALAEIGLQITRQQEKHIEYVDRGGRKLFDGCFTTTEDKE